MGMHPQPRKDIFIMNNAKFDEYMAKKHPALQTDSEAAYVNVQTKVADKYGIVQLASDLLVAMNFADATRLIPTQRKP
jgi:hypothetical protein